MYYFHQMSEPESIAGILRRTEYCALEDVFKSPRNNLSSYFFNMQSLRALQKEFPEFYASVIIRVTPDPGM